MHCITGRQADRRRQARELACLPLGNARQSDRRKKAPRRAVQPHSVSVWLVGSCMLAASQRITARRAGHRGTRSMGYPDGCRWAGTVPCVFSSTSRRASDPPAHRASDFRHPLVPARTRHSTYRTDLRAPLSAPRRIERDTVLRARKTGGEGRPHTAYPIYCMARSRMKMGIECAPRHDPPSGEDPMSESCPCPVSCPMSCPAPAPANPETACGGRFEACVQAAQGRGRGGEEGER
ncbi:hypothetical protein V8D89_004063 [Ganoderma adspersum]